MAMLSHYVYSMTNVRLRELTLGYDLPSKWFRNKVNMSVSFVGRNLFMFYNKAPFDPRSDRFDEYLLSGCRLLHAAERPHPRIQCKTPILKLNRL